jgi:hypothetical protein
MTTGKSSGSGSGNRSEVDERNVVGVTFEDLSEED